jgi:hypothetical protein
VSFAILWGPRARFVFYELPRHSAAIVDRSVIRLAETGEGELEWAPPHHRLRAGKYDVARAIDLAARTIAVLRIYRARP